MNVWLTESFLTHWKQLMLLRFLKKGTIIKRKTIAQWVCSQYFQKCLKNYYLNKLMTICKVFLKASYRFLQKPQHSKCSVGYNWKMGNCFKKTQSGYSFYGFDKILWYIGSLSIEMNKIHLRSLRLLLKNYKDDFQDLLRSSGDMSIHQRCINLLLTEVYKCIHELSTKIMNEVFSSK